MNWHKEIYVYININKTIEKIKNIVNQNKRIFIDHTNKFEIKIFKNQFESEKSALEKQLIKGFLGVLYMQNKASKLNNVVFMIDVNKLREINLTFFVMLQHFGYIYKNYSNNIILLHTEQLTTISSYIDFNKSIILNFLNEYIHECNICFTNDQCLLSGCLYCDFYMSVDCLK